MRPHHDGSNVLQLSLVLAFILGKWHQPSLIEVIGYAHGLVEESEDLG